MMPSAGLAFPALALAAVMTFAAAAIRGLTGFGMAIILVPLLGLVVRPDEAVIIAILLQLFIAPVGIGKIVRDADRASAGLIVGAAMIATPFGVWLLAHTAPDTARVIIAGIAIAAFLLVLLPPRPHSTPGTVETLATGLAAGVLTGFAAMPGPPVVPYYLRQTISAERARASMLLVFFGTAIAATLSSFLLGLISAPVLWLSILLFPAVLLGNWLGSKAFGRISERVWRSAVALILGLAGLSAVWRLIQS
jgi:uncharacterized membrane protein YfcA